MFTYAQKKEITEMVHSFRAIMIKELNLKVFPIRAVKFSTRCTRRYGQCTRHKEFGVTTEATITISDIATQNPKLLKETVLHELCHALPDTKGHDRMFKHYTSIVNRFFNTNIGTYVRSELIDREWMVENGKVRSRSGKRYTVACECGKFHHTYKRKTRFVEAVIRDGGKTWSHGTGLNKCRGKFYIED
jgi:hypothetical protein